MKNEGKFASVIEIPNPSVGIWTKVEGIEEGLEDLDMAEKVAFLVDFLQNSLGTDVDI